MPEGSSSSHQQALAEFLSATGFAQLPGEVVARARWVVADSLAVIGAAMQEPEMRSLVTLLAEEEGAGPATVVGASAKLARSMAAFANGTAGTFLELDEGNQFARGIRVSTSCPRRLRAAKPPAAAAANCCWR